MDGEYKNPFLKFFGATDLEGVWHIINEDYPTAGMLYYKLVAFVNKYYKKTLQPDAPVPPPLPLPAIITNGNTTDHQIVEGTREPIERGLDEVLNYPTGQCVVRDCKDKACTDGEHFISMRRVELLSVAINHVKDFGGGQNKHSITAKKNEPWGLGKVMREMKDVKPSGNVNQRSLATSGPDSRTRAPYRIIHALCRVEPKIAFESHGSEDPAFHVAAQAGFTQLLDIMVRELESSLEVEATQGKGFNLTEKALESLSRKSNGSTALRKAAESRHLEVLELLSKKFPQLVDIDSLCSTIKGASPKEDENTQSTSLGAFRILARVKGILSEEETADDAEVWEQAVTVNSTSVLELLLDLKSKKKFAKYERADFVIEKGSVNMWNLFNFDLQRTFINDARCDFLHKAVYHRKQDLVGAILSVFPGQAEANRGTAEKPDYPLQQLRAKDNGNGNDKSDDETKNPTFTAIRNQLLCTMIRSRNLGIQDIRKILEDSQVDGYLMCLHLATVDTSERSFADYVKFLTNQTPGPHSIFKFESVLKYVRFPTLEGPPSTRRTEQARDRQVDHTEIEGVFNWLGAFGVTKVMEVSVPDRLYNPHADDVVAKCINGRDVRLLKWKKLDLYLGNLYTGSNADAEALEELDLYSSGNQSVHDQWYRQLNRFPNLRRLSVYVVKDVMSDARVDKVLSTLENDLAGIKKRLEEREERRKKMLEESQARGLAGVTRKRKDGTSPPFTLTSRSWDSDQVYVAPTNLEDITLKTAWPRLDGFVKEFANHYVLNEDTERTKVALIDSGVVVYGGLDQINSSKNTVFSNDLAHRVVDGVSLVSTDDAEQLYWHASEPHGTQMAKLISSINPCCRLYVIKVTETRKAGVPASNVAAAIEWARRKRVDVISLSLVVHQDRDNKLEEQIRLAKDDDIVVVSSTADGGWRKDNTAMSANKSSHKEIITIAASDWDGNILEKSQKTGYNYRVVGENVPVGLVPFLRSRECVSGSSAATALAAGLASLIVACSRISPNCATNGTAGKWRGRIVSATLDAMSIGETAPKWVDLDNLCGRGKQLAGSYQFANFVADNFKFGKNVASK
ncbi:hypothetical protein CC80DRAFT_589716 [Byssothecium circinans]|uniref:Peptidase S8/S53 domain-containing protein n=1 Tax=Byssothecium circinans TaxID=147558 RepID=A0A6A5U9D5_9PLEO|nr:hypothetical protein CC80DRAFT_589716 [Byssothecium circinans]